MKLHKLKERLNKNRPMTTITLHIPEDVVEDLKRVAPAFGFSGYQPLIQYYIGQGLRVDLERLDHSPLQPLMDRLKYQGEAETPVTKVVEETPLEVGIS